MSEADISKLRISRDTVGTQIKPRLRGLRRFVLIAAVVAVAGLLVARAMMAPVEVETATVSVAYRSQSFTLLNATGYVVAQRKAAVASKATGRLEWLGVREGSVVRQHDVLARLENRDVTASMEQAAANIKVTQANLEQGEAELNEAERNFNRSRDLLAKNFVSQAAHDTAIGRLEKARAAVSGYRAAIAVAQANHRAAQVAVEQTLIRAPFDGVVLTKNANVGDVITPFSSALGSQAAVVTMADMSTLEVEADVSESNLAKIKLDQPCEIQLDAIPDARFRGRLLRLVPTVDRTKATVMAKVRFAELDPRILPEMSAKVSFLSQEVPDGERGARVAVQSAAVVTRDGKSVVFIVRDGRAVQATVEPGDKIGELLEIRSGVVAGDKLVLRPSEKLRDGARVVQGAR
ncbi:MAG: efflux RND transporter periplasmic adaptor subunit [Betaproteobacteria bacterium]|nr:efflux RND transporter periplasmic adaptor subunit [Betaproteobacteria bacterium]